MKKVVAQVDVNNAVDVLVMLKGRSDANQALDAPNVAKSHSMKNYIWIGRAMANLKYTKPKGIKSTITIKVVQPINGRKLVEEMNRLGDAKLLAQSTGNVTSPITKNPGDQEALLNEQERKLEVKKEPKFVSKLTDEFKVVSAQEILLEKAVIELHGYRIEGSFSIIKL